MNEAVEIRVATPDDFDWLFDLHRIVFRLHIEQIWGWDERLGFRKAGQAGPFIEMAWPGPAEASPHN